MAIEKSVSIIQHILKIEFFRTFLYNARIMKTKEKIINFIKKEMILCAAFVLAVISTLIIKPSAYALKSAIDFRVLGLLFCLMAVIQGFRSVNILDKAAQILLKKCRSKKSLYFCFVFLIFFASMAVTNDVALLTFVPLTLLVCRHSKINAAPLVVLETISANLGSCITPMGNPQNLFLYSFYNMDSITFFATTAKIAIPSALLLAVSILAFNRSAGGYEPESFTEIKIEKLPAIAYTGLLAVNLLSVFRMLDYRIAFAATVIVTLICNRKILLKVDYCLLLTFVSFFVFTKNMAAIPSLSEFFRNTLQDRMAVYISGIAASQVISNVPAALLLAGFTGHAKELLLGVNVGGLGTLIASLASVISYKLYASDIEAGNQDSSPVGKYFILFTVMNVIFLLILIPLCVALQNGSVL